ncbi:MAG: UpxY family transcription antiterminator [Bacteroidales bacterium]|jgi:transcription antitermination factor NusG|nr:UpxY family transcription antiterminator [Bacteroidales bacterium]
MQTNQLLNKGWYVVYTKPCHEKKVYEELLFRCYISYLPLIKKTSVWSDRRKVVEKPLFPSYVFVYLEHVSKYYEVLQIKGVVTFIRFCCQLARVKESEIETIKKLIANCSTLNLSSLNVTVGDKRTILSGPLAGFECEVISISKGNRKILVRIDSLKQNIIAEY